MGTPLVKISVKLLQRVSTRSRNIEAILAPASSFRSHYPCASNNSPPLTTICPAPRRPLAVRGRVFVGPPQGHGDKPQPAKRAWRPSAAAEQVPLLMCIYIQTIPLCGHPPPALLSYAFCNNILAQLMRITEPEAWKPENMGQVPFDMPDDCDPGPDNIYILYSDDYCGWECRNNAYQLAAGLGGLSGEDGGMLPAYFPGNERGQFVGGGYGGEDRLMVMGMPDAKYGPGSERLGVGWRNA
ncbi:hypothetical protein diail_10653 [Diaporthe ilicicola]|nr:hypothetical protein diail_10653 [Diaporthe ilicicola]